MHPLSLNPVAKAHVAELHRQAEQDRLAQAARRAPRARRGHGRQSVLGLMGSTPLRRPLAALRARSRPATGADI